MPDDSDNRQAGGPYPNGPIQRPYQSPRLMQYGTVRDLTKALTEVGDDNNPGTPDGSTM